jgi:hypothetical protein
MAELIPLLGGSLAGVVLARCPSGRARAAFLLVVSVALALVAGIVSGELSESPWFLLWDTAQALAGGAVAAAFVAAPSALARRRSRRG